jgi:hypothetical protein
MMIDIDCFPIYIYIYIYAWAIYDYKWEYCLSIIQDCKLLNLNNSISVRDYISLAFPFEHIIGEHMNSVKPMIPNFQKS